MIRIGAVVDTFDLGGFELACLDLLRRLDPEKFTSSVYAFRPGSLVLQAREAGIPVVVGHDKQPADREWVDADTRAREAWTARLVELLSAAKVDVCLTWAWPEAIPAARAAGVRAVVERVDGPSLAIRVADKSDIARVIVESRTVRDVLLVQRERVRLDPRRVVVIRNGVDLERFDPRRFSRESARASLGLPRDGWVVGTVARLAPEKNLAQAIAAFAMARNADASFAHRAWLVLTGPDGGSRADLEQIAAENGIGDRVVFSGPTSDQPAVLAAFDAFVTTSYTEGSPAAVLEAMAMGLPLVATPVGALLELIDGNALLVDVMAPRATCEAFLNLFRAPELGARLGARSRAIARRWGVARQVRHYERVIEEAWREATA